MKSEDYNVEEVEIDLNKYFMILKRRWWIILLTCFFTVDLALLAAILPKSEYQSEAKLLFESGRQTSSLIGLEDTPQELKSLTSRDDPLDTQVQIIRSIPLAEQVISRLQLSNESGDLIKPRSFLSKLEAGGIPGTDVLSIAYTSDSPKQAAEIVNTVMSVYIAQNVKSNRSAAFSAQRFIENQLPLTEAKVDQAENFLKEFKEMYDIVDLEKESERIVDTLSSLEDNLTQLRGQYANLDSQSVTIQGRLELDTGKAYESGVISQSPAVKEVLTRLHTAESDLASALSLYEENNPVVIDLRSQIASLQALLNQRVSGALNNESLVPVAPSSGTGKSIKQDLIEKSLLIETERAGLSQQIQELTSAKTKYQQRAQALPSIEKRYRDLERKLNAAKGTYQRLLDNLQEAKVLQNQSIGNASIISPAQEPTLPIGLPKRMYLMGGTIIGLILGLMLAFLADLADQINSIEEIQQLYDFPLLGIIGDAYESNAPQNALSEHKIAFSPLFPQVNLNTYAEIQATLQARYRENMPKIIGITSTTENEDKKSLIAAGFATIFGQLEHKVLVIDINFRKPSQHHLWNISNQLGISDVIAYQVPMVDAIQHINPKIDVLPIGTARNKASSILQSQAFTDFIHEYQEKYDYILLDTPSILGKLNISAISSIMSFLIVAQPNLLKKSDIHKAKKILSKQGQNNILGLVASRFSKNTHKFKSSYVHSRDNGNLDEMHTLPALIGPGNNSNP